MKEVSKRYGEALFSLAQEQGLQEQCLKDLLLIQNLIDDNKDFQSFLTMKLVNPKEAADALKEISHLLKISKLVQNFLQLLAHQRRLMLLQEIIRYYQKQLNVKEGIVEAEVTSALEINTMELQALKDTLSKKFAKTVQIHQKIDASLLGGAVLKIGSFQVDFSLKTQLGYLKRTLQG
jgi:F-type H+-transporting ATPase subunit delta